MFDFSFNSISSNIIGFFGFAFPLILGFLYLIFSYLVFRIERNKFNANKISLIFLLIALFLVSSLFPTDMEWMNAIRAGLLLILSIQLIDLQLPNLRDPVAIRSAKLVLIFLSFLFLLAQLILNLLGINWIEFGQSGLLNFWSGVLFLFSFFFILLRKENLKNNQKISLLDFYLPVSLFSFLPLGIWLIVNFSQFVSTWIFVPMLFGLLWIAIFLISYQKDQTPRKLKKIKGLPFCLLISSIAGLLIYLILYFQKTHSIPDIQIAKIISFYIFVFSLGYFAYLFWFMANPRSTFQSQKINSVDLSKFDTKEELIEELRKMIISQLNPRSYIHFVHNPTSQLYKPYKFLDTPDSNLSFPQESGLVQTLINSDEILIMNHDEPFKEDLIGDKEMLELLAADAFIPIKAKGHLLGWISLNFEVNDFANIQKKTSKIRPSINDYANQIMKLDNQMKLELREKNFNVLSRIVQGVNYTLDLDDIYELIFAQTSQLIQSNDFFIILKDQNSPKLRSVFYVEGDERIHNQENQFILFSDSLEADVIKNGRGVLANNYLDYCKSRKLESHRENVHNALVAPLNTGDKTIGCIFLAKRNSEDAFTNEQLDLLQSITDMVAGAIEKARLMDKTQHYAHQLTALNDLLRKLSSIINIDALLKSFLDFSNELIEFEESRLIILDDNSTQFIYQEVKGEKSLPLKNEKISLSFKLHEEVFNSKNIFVIDQNSYIDDATYAFYRKQNVWLQSLMIIPLVIKENVFGFIELINRTDDHIFSENDKQLMQTFAAQAAITWENTRLYQQTDQELADRVQELSTMQKIDRELNASLEIETTMEITLSWAMKWLNADAGWIGLVKDEWITDIKQAGFEDQTNFEFPKSQPLSIVDNLKFDNQLTSRKLSVDEIEKFHPLTKEQIFSPIFREDQLVAVIVLELFHEIPFTNNEKKFLERLSDHASIALMNSLFYEEIQKANLAKSEFVSLVAHELKNPMTSIKGYTELLTTGAAGEISETQDYFLSIIRNNTDRMNALVSDLNDLTKIETGNIHLESKPTRIEDIFDDVVRSISKQIDQKNQTLIVNIINDVPTIWVDPIRLTQILINLLSNANKYTKDNGIISLLAEKIKRPDSNGKSDFMAHIWVKDTGIGISEEDQKLIFQKFFRSEDQEVRAVSGTGLGLNITRSLIEMMGGSIWFESEIEKGTTFHIVVPLFEN